MRILGISDFVSPSLSDGFNKDRFQGVDLIISCGDLPPEYLTHLASSFQVPLFYVCGNHDIRFPETPPVGCVNIHRDIVEYKGLKFLGLEGSRWYNGGPFQYSEKEMRKMIRRLWLNLRLKKGVDVLITHAPPRFLGDREDMCHRGFRSFRNFILKNSPGYFVHGHIHEAFRNETERITEFNNTKVINVCGHFIFEVEK